ncbi:MAG: transketolase C-terminal domain-containing protein [Pseudomonadota bacterium]
MSTSAIKPMTMRDAFLETLFDVMENEERSFFLSADFGAPALDKIRERMPDRFLNIGIAEQNLINVAAGLSLEGYIVFAYAIAPFITMRCYEQIRINLALLSDVRTLNVNLIGVGAGYSYVVSGPTHQCLEDLSIMRTLPNMQVYSPADHISASKLVDICIKNTGPKYLRFDAQTLPALYTDLCPDITQGFYVHRLGSSSISLVATGYMVHTALAVAKQLDEIGYSVGVIDIFSLSLFSTQALKKQLECYSSIVTLEEGFQGRGGLDALMAAFISRHNLPIRLLPIGIEGGYRFDLGSREILHGNVGIDSKSILERVRKFIV